MPCINVNCKLCEIDSSLVIAERNQIPPSTTSIQLEKNTQQIDTDMLMNKVEHLAVLRARYFPRVLAKTKIESKDIRNTRKWSTGLALNRWAETQLQMTEWIFLCKCKCVNKKMFPMFTTSVWSHIFFCCLQMAKLQVQIILHKTHQWILFKTHQSVAKGVTGTWSLS